MKKVVRTVWIAALSGMAFLAACCTTKGGLTRAERKQLIKERDSIQEILSRREGECIYGTPEIMAQYKLDGLRLQCQLDSINSRLGEEVDLERSSQRYALQQRIAELETILYERENSCIYGSPEMLEQRREENWRMQEELKDLKSQLKDLY